MSRAALLLAVLSLVLPSLARAESTDFLPAGMLLTCTMDEPNFSSKTAEVGDPVLCYIGSTAAFGEQVFPRGAYVSGRLQDDRAPGHFYGKGWLQIGFDRLVLPGEAIVPLNAKLIEASHYKVDKHGKIDGKGHATRDAVEWAIPVLWPIKLATLPARGPYPKLAGEQTITLRVMQDTVIPFPVAARNRVPMPPWAHPSAAPAFDSPARDNSVSVVPLPGGGFRLVNAGSIRPTDVIADEKMDEKLFATNAAAISSGRSTSAKLLPTDDSAGRVAAPPGDGYKLVRSDAGAPQDPAPKLTLPPTAKASSPRPAPTLIVLNGNGTIFARSYRLQGNRVLCLLEDGALKTIPLSSVNFAETVRANRNRGVPLASGKSNANEALQ
jgi:hypothetical protein